MLLSFRYEVASTSQPTDQNLNKQTCLTITFTEHFKLDMSYINQVTQLGSTTQIKSIFQQFVINISIFKCLCNLNKRILVKSQSLCYIFLCRISQFWSFFGFFLSIIPTNMIKIHQMSKTSQKTYQKFTKKHIIE